MKHNCIMLLASFQPSAGFCLQIHKAIGWQPEPLPLPAPAAARQASWRPVRPLAAVEAITDSLLLEEPVMPPGSSGGTASARNGGNCNTAAAIMHSCLQSIELPDAAQLLVPPLATAFDYTARDADPLDMPVAAGVRSSISALVCGGLANTQPAAAAAAAEAEAAMLEVPLLVPLGVAAAGLHTRGVEDCLAWAAAEAAAVVPAVGDPAEKPVQPLADARFATYDDIVFQGMLLEQRSALLPHVDVGGDAGSAEQVHYLNPYVQLSNCAAFHAAAARGCQQRCRRCRQHAAGKSVRSVVLLSPLCWLLDGFEIASNSGLMILHH